MSAVLRYLLLFEGLGLAGVPLAAAALSKLPGAGVGLARILAWLLLAWLVWILGSLGAPNGLPLVLVCAAGLIVAAVVLHRRRRGERDRFRRRLFVAGEVVFVVSFLIAAFIGSYASDVWGTEKPMDMMLANSTLTSSSFPPHDPWLSGYDVNYYYLGHHMLGLTIRLTGVEPSVGYNLALAALFALVISTTFGLVATIAEAGRVQGMRIRRPLGAGLVGIVVLALMGNLRGGWQGWHADKWATFDWFAPSRIIPNTINEFPVFSLNLGDLHAHVLAIPLTLLALAFSVQVAIAGRGGVFTTFCAALSIGWLYAVNSWSWPVMAGVFALAVWVRLRGKRTWADAAWGAGVIGLGIVLILPFIIDFSPNAKGLGWTTKAQREPFGTFVTHHLVLEGALLWLLLAPLVSRALALPNRGRTLLWSVGAAAILLPLLGASNLAGAALAALLAGVTFVAATGTRRTPVERTLWAIASAGLLSLLAAELGTVKDEFAGGEFERMNTVFKMGYQTWILLAVFGAVALAAGREWLGARIPRYAWTAVAAGLIAVSLGYTVVGTYARRGAFKGDRHLDGRVWLEPANPGDVAAIDWLRAHADHDAVVLESVGDDYSQFGNARISTYTGLQTLLGWQGHELQWDHAEPLVQRRADVMTLYQSPDRAQVGQLLDTYRIDYAVVGPLETTTYGKPKALTQEGKVVFKRKGTTIYAFA